MTNHGFIRLCTQKTATNQIGSITLTPHVINFGLRNYTNALKEWLL
jgi:hypothetical protein